MKRSTPRRTRSITLAATTICIAAVAAAWLVAQEPGDRPVMPAVAFVADTTTLDSCPDDRADPDAVSCRGQALGNLALRRGAPVALERLDRDRAQDPVTAASCHWLAHWIGRAALAREEGRVGRAFADGSELCASGYYHGVVDRVLVGMSSREADVVLLRACTDPVVRLDQALRYACVHGLGHALVARHGELPASIDACEQLTRSDEGDCAGGAIMEHFERVARAAGPGARDARALARDCGTLHERHASTCARGVGSALVTHQDPKSRLAAAGRCGTLSAAVRAHCAQAAGEAIAEAAPTDDEHVVAACLDAGELAEHCVAGAARFRALEDDATELCATAPAALRQACTERALP